MKNAFKIIALVLCVTMLFSACSNKKSTENESTTETTEQNIETNTNNSIAKDTGVVSLPYNQADGVNPYFAKSNENLYICSLLYDSLYTIDKNYKANPQIAQNISVNGNTATVQLRTDEKCRGSQPIDAYDVVYSFNLAKASYGWGGYLNGISSAVVKSTFSVAFTLDFEDVYVGAKLCFPIVKSGTADIQTDIPTGSGDYYYLEGELYSNHNDSKITLYSIGSNKSSENAFKIGATDVYFNDLSNCEYIGITGKTEEITLNNMVYLGLNSANGALNKYVRSAIAAGLNSEDVVVSTYQGHGAAVKMPINPNVDYFETISLIDVKGDVELAQKILDRCGFIKYSGTTKSNGAYTLNFDLIVNRENKYRMAAAYNIADCLNKMGFFIIVNPLSFEDYNQRITEGNYDMYIGEVKLDGSMDLSQFFLENGNLSAGIDKSSSAVTEYFNYRAGKITIDEYYEVFAEEYPFVPVLFRNGYVVTSADIKSDLSKTPFDLYENLSN